MKIIDDIKARIIDAEESLQDLKMQLYQYEDLEYSFQPRNMLVIEEADRQKSILFSHMMAFKQNNHRRSDGTVSGIINDSSVGPQVWTGCKDSRQSFVFGIDFGSELVARAALEVFGDRIRLWY